MTRFRPVFCAAVVVSAALSCAGCGRRGPLEPPPGAADTGAPLTGVPDSYGLPKNSEVAPIDAASVAPSASGAPNLAPAAAAPKPQHKSFPLDPLL